MRWSLAIGLGTSAFLLALTYPSPLCAIASAVMASAAAAVLCAAAHRRTTDLGRAPDWLLHRELMRCRRRDEEAHVLVIDMVSTRRELDRVLGTFRATDAVVAERDLHKSRIHAVLASERFDRLGLEERLTKALRGSRALVGWASFPRDGLTLEVLLQHASTAAAAGAAPACARGEGNAPPPPIAAGITLLGGATAAGTVSATPAPLQEVAAATNSEEA